MEQPLPPAPPAFAQVSAKPDTFDAQESYAQQLEGFRQSFGINNSSPATAPTSVGDASSFSQRLTDVRQSLKNGKEDGAVSMTSISSMPISKSGSADPAASERQLAGLAGWILGALSRGEDPKELAAFALGSQPFGRTFSAGEVRSELLAQLNVLAPQPRQELLERLGAASGFENMDSPSKASGATDPQAPPSDALAFCEALERGLEQLRGGFQRLSSENSGLRQLLCKKTAAGPGASPSSSPSKRAAEADGAETSVEALHNRLAALLSRVTQRAEHSERLAILLDHSHEQLAQLSKIRLGTSSYGNGIVPPTLTTVSTLPQPPAEVRQQKVVRMSPGQSSTQGIRVSPAVSTQVPRRVQQTTGTTATFLTTPQPSGMVRCSSAPPLRQWCAPQAVMTSAPTFVAAEHTSQAVSPGTGTARRVASPVGAGIRVLTRGGMTVTPRARGLDLKAGACWIERLDPRNVASDFVAFGHERVASSQGSRVRSPERN